MSNGDSLDSLIDELTELRTKGLSTEELAKSIAELVLTKTNVPALVAFWVISSHNQVRLDFYVESKSDFPWTQLLASQEHSRFLRNAIQKNLPVGLERIVWNSNEMLAKTTQVICDNRTWGILEVLLRPDSRTANIFLSDGLLSILRCEMESAKQADELTLRTAANIEYESSHRIAARLLSCSDFSKLTFQLAHEAREFFSCDRASILSIVYPKARVEAISGVDSLDRKAASLKAMQSLIQTVAVTGETLRYPLSAENHPPQIVEACDNYADKAQAKSFEVHLIKSNSEPIAQSDTKQLPEVLGALLLESFHVPDFRAPSDKINRLLPLACSAFTSAWKSAATTSSWLPVRWTRIAQDLPLGWGRSKYKQSKSWVVALGAILAAFAIPLPVIVRCEGQLQPLLRRDLYAPADGEVVSVEFHHDAWVESNQNLLVLSSRALDLEQQKIEGELQTTEKRLLAVLSERLENNSDSESNLRSTGQVAAEEQELQELRTSLQKQLEIIRKQQRSLSLTAPISGRILTWDPKHLLLNRPVQRGQLLTTIADTQGEWILELKVQGRNVSKLIAQTPRSDKPLDVRYTLATLPKESYRAKLTELAARVDWDPEYKESLLALAPTLNLPETNARPGVKVVARIHCGWYPIGLTWLSDIYNGLKTWLWL